ncbi:MAG: hypothetical protein FOGNACKC_02341 [Anaerolineae bacterium]|nr:hypothetical protein [Anaerolineae bacterium]
MKRNTMPNMLRFEKLKAKTRSHIYKTRMVDDSAVTARTAAAA